jgi:hypothetical protein
MIDPEYWSDEEIGHWSHAARLLYIGLWNFADDEGRFKAADELLKSQIFPYDRRVSIRKLKEELGRKIQWYEVEGLKYGFIRNFLKYQRIDKPTQSKLPSPPEFDELSPSDQGGVPPKISKEKLSKEKRREEKAIPPSLDEVITYFKTNGYREDAGRRAWNYYHESQWKDSRGKQVVSWKSKMQAVWFKDENKATSTADDWQPPENGERH